MNTASNVAAVLSDISNSARFANQSASNKISVDRKQFYDMVDYRNPVFAEMIRDTLVSEANKHGFARRYLNVIHKSIGVDSENKTMTFDLKAEDKVAQMEEQFVAVQNQRHVAEDVQFFQLLRQHMNPMNVRDVRMKDMTLAMFLTMRSRGGANMRAAFCGSTFMNLIVAGDDFTRNYNPTVKFEDLLTGHLGELALTEISSDSYRPPTQKCVRPNEIFFLPQPELLADLILDEQETPLRGIEIGQNQVSYAFPSAFRIENLKMANVAMINIVSNNS